MGFPTSEVGYTAAMPRREDHVVHKDVWWHWTKKIETKAADSPEPPSSLHQVTLRHIQKDEF